MIILQEVSVEEGPDDVNFHFSAVPLTPVTGKRRKRESLWVMRRWSEILGETDGYSFH